MALLVGSASIRKFGLYLLLDAWKFANPQSPMKMIGRHWANCWQQWEAIRDVQQQLAQTATDPNLTLITSSFLPFRLLPNGTYELIPLPPREWDFRCRSWERNRAFSNFS